jgi:hypothetical protein
LATSKIGLVPLHEFPVNLHGHLVHVLGVILRLLCHLKKFHGISRANPFVVLHLLGLRQRPRIVAQLLPNDLNHMSLCGRLAATPSPR